MLGIPSFAFDAYDFCIDLPPRWTTSAGDLHQPIRRIADLLPGAGNRARPRRYDRWYFRKPRFAPGKISRFRAHRSIRLEFPLGKTRSYLSSAMLGMLAGVMANHAPQLATFLRLARRSPVKSAQAWQTGTTRPAGSPGLGGAYRHYILTGFGAEKANADEVGLKIIEVVGESATSFGLEEFTHGPTPAFAKIWASF